jgi:hypothetical protein
MTDYESAVLSELRAIRRLLEARQVPRDDRHAALVAAIGKSAGGAAFTVAELLQHALVDPALRAAINGQSGRQLGRLLRRIEGEEFAGLVVERVGEDSNGVIRVVRPRKPLLQIA